MTDLENQMKFNMELRGYSPKTIKNYLICVSNFAKHYNKPLDLIDDNEVQNYIHYCITEKHLCEGTVNYYHSALKFFYTKVLDKTWKHGFCLTVK